MQLPEAETTARHEPQLSALYHNSVPRLFLERAGERPESVAFRCKDLGVPQEVTWRRFRDEVAAFAHGLVALGLKPGDPIALMGDLCFQCFVADMAALSVGAITFGIRATCSAPEVRHQLADARARFLVAVNQECVAKVLATDEPLPDLERIVVCDMRAMSLHRDDRIASFMEVEDAGRVHMRVNPGRFEQLACAVKPEDTAVFVYTSSRRGPPKATVLTHRDLLAGAAIADLQCVPASDSGAQRIMTQLPLGHLIRSWRAPCVTIQPNPTLLSPGAEKLHSRWRRGARLQQSTRQAVAR